MVCYYNGVKGDFYSRASCEARRPCIDHIIPVSNFYSRASCEARLCWRCVGLLSEGFLLTRLV